MNYIRKKVISLRWKLSLWYKGAGPSFKTTYIIIFIFVFFKDLSMQYVNKKCLSIFRPFYLLHKICGPWHATDEIGSSQIRPNPLRQNLCTHQKSYKCVEMISHTGKLNDWIYSSVYGIFNREVDKYFIFV